MSCSAKRGTLGAHSVGHSGSGRHSSLPSLHSEGAGQHSVRGQGGEDAQDPKGSLTTGQGRNQVEEKAK